MAGLYSRPILARSRDLKRYAESIGSNPHGRFEIDDWPTRATVAHERRALPSPEEGLVNLLLRDVTGLNFGQDHVNKCNFGFEPGLQADDQTIVQRDGPVWFGRREVDFLDFLGRHRTLNDSAADCRGNDEC
jgi:hypothetical protein